MSRTVTAIAVGLCVVTIVATSVASRTATRPPRTLDEKVKEADLILVGTATVLKGERGPATSHPAVDHVQVEIKEILWPPGLTNSGRIKFFADVLRDSPQQTTNLSGVFFFKKSQSPTDHLWDRLDGADWIERATNALVVQLSIPNHKRQQSPAIVLKVPSIPWPAVTRYDHNPQARDAYMNFFKEGFFDALKAQQTPLGINAPTEEADKAKVLGYADGQLAGQVARVQWERNLQLLLTSTVIDQSVAPSTK